MYFRLMRQFVLALQPGQCSRLSKHADGDSAKRPSDNIYRVGPLAPPLSCTAEAGIGLLCAVTSGYKLTYDLIARSNGPGNSQDSDNRSHSESLATGQLNYTTAPCRSPINFILFLFFRRIQKVVPSGILSLWSSAGWLGAGVIRRAQQGLDLTRRMPVLM